MVRRNYNRIHELKGQFNQYLSRNGKRDTILGLIITSLSFNELDEISIKALRNGCSFIFVLGILIFY